MALVHMLVCLFFQEVEGEHFFLHFGIMEVYCKIGFQKPWCFGKTCFVNPFKWIVLKLVVLSLMVVEVLHLFAMAHSIVIEF